MEGNNYTPVILYERLKKFTIRIVKLSENLPKTAAGYKIGGQIIDSSGSMGANYAEALASRSKKEFIAICGIILKENKETTFWLEIILSSDLSKNAEEIKNLIKESKELEKIFAQTIISANKNIK